MRSFYPVILKHVAVRKKDQRVLLGVKVEKRMPQKQALKEGQVLNIAQVHHIKRTVKEETKSKRKVTTKRKTKKK